VAESTGGRMAGKRVLVTGAGTGIGAGIAEKFAAEGARVAVHYAHSRSGADELVARLRAAGAAVEAFGADFTDVGEVRSLADRAIAWLGGIDVLVNNAGITMNIPFEEVRVEQFDTVYNVNIRAMFFLTQACTAVMATQSRGVVINLSSLHAFAGMRAYTVYAGTKGAIVTFTRTLAIELAPKGIRVNAIAPGPVVVDNHYKADPDYDPVAKGQGIPAGFEGVPGDISGVAVFLASDEARYIYGQTIVVDGGATSFWCLTDAFRKPSPIRYGKGYVPGIE
jgi:NAD(P)-dependent dehydrogenase (short-subunit alcohol dehydrogenase family)